MCLTVTCFALSTCVSWKKWLLKYFENTLTAFNGELFAPLPAQHKMLINASSGKSGIRSGLMCLVEASFHRINVLRLFMSKINN